MPIIKLYRWRYYDPWFERTVETKYVATAETILQSHPDAEKIPGTEEIREVPDNWVEMTTGGSSATYPGHGRTNG